MVLHRPVERAAFIGRADYFRSHRGPMPPGGGTVMTSQIGPAEHEFWGEGQSVGAVTAMAPLRNP